MKKVLLVKYGEIALRKGNRGLFERGLADTIQKMIGDKAIKVSREQGRLLVEDSRGDIDSPGVIEKIRRTFGITAICISLKLENAGIQNLQEAALTVLKDMGRSTYNGGNSDSSDNVNNSDSDSNIRTFKVETKRSDKRYPMDSREISAAVGEYILNHHPNLTVDVRNPETVVWIEIRNCAYVYIDVIKCEAGLPYGSSGKGVLLLSGGIDSPVAGYMMARRGMEIIPVYFHSPPYTTERAKDKVLDLMECLCGFIGQSPLYVVPFTETQLYIYENMPHAKLTLFLKRAMLHITSIIAEKEKAHCLITGDSVGQVASQTAHSIAAVDSATQFTVLRPLAAVDKQQIIDTAKQIGTYDISIRPYEDCCTVFVAKHPENKPNTAVIEKKEAQLYDGLAPLLDTAISNAHWENI